MMNHIAMAGQRILDKLDEKYQSGIHWALDHRKSVVLVSAALMGVTVLLVPLIGVELMPETDEGEVRIRVEMPTGTRLDATDEVCRRIESLVVRDVPELEHLMTEVGGTSFWDASSTHVADHRLTLKDKDERTRSTQQIAAAIRQTLPPMPGVLVRTRAGGNRMFRMG
jgi:HAE1 family hydrophobic/amphiphilic exporter-1